MINRSRVARPLWGLGLVALAASILLAGPALARDKDSGMKAQELDPSNRGVVAGIGIEAQDIVRMTDQMMRSIMEVPELAGRATPPRVIVDDQYFHNESTQRINKSIITDRLRVGLNRASKGRMVFIGREFSDMVAEERALKRDGVTDAGTTGMTHAQAGADFRLTGKMTSLDAMQGKTGVSQRYNQITFEMVDLESGVIVWSDIYQVQRAAADDVVYR